MEEDKNCINDSFIAFMFYDPHNFVYRQLMNVYILCAWIVGYTIYFLQFDWEYAISEFILILNPIQ